MPNKFYLTKKGLKKIEKEYQDLKKIRLAKAKGGVFDFSHSKDFNPKYSFLQEEDTSLLDSKITELEYISKNAEMIKSPPKKEQNIINLGATVTLENSEGKINEFMIVGTLEADPKEGKISSESPVGKALLNHKISDEIEINSPAKIIYKIKNIGY